MVDNRTLTAQQDQISANNQQQFENHSTGSGGGGGGGGGGGDEHDMQLDSRDGGFGISIVDENVSPVRGGAGGGGGGEVIPSPEYERENQLVPLPKSETMEGEVGGGQVVPFVSEEEKVSRLG